MHRSILFAMVALLGVSAEASPPMRATPSVYTAPAQSWTLTANADTTSALVYITSGTNQLVLSSGNWPAWAAGATVCVPNAGQAYTTNAAGTTWIAGTAYVKGDLVNYFGLMLTPFVNNSDTSFSIADWYAVLGGAITTDLETTIVSVSGNTATLAINASSTVTSGSPSTCWYGLDDTASFNSVLATASTAGGGLVVVPSGTYQISGVEIPSNVNVVMQSATIRPTMPVTNPDFLLRGTPFTSNCGITGTWTADFTGVQAQRYTAGSWVRKFMGGVFVDAAQDFQISGCTGLNLTGDNVVQIQPTGANVNPIRGRLSNIICTQSSGYGQCGFGAVQIDGGTAIASDTILSYSIGRAYNLESDDDISGPRTISGITASNIQQLGSNGPIDQEALGIVCHSNTIYDVSVRGVLATAGGNGGVIASGSAQLSNFVIDGVNVSGGGGGIGVVTNSTVTNGLIENGIFTGCTLLSLSTGQPVGGTVFTSGLTYLNCSSTNGVGSGFRSVFFNGSQGAVAIGTATFTNCTSTGNGLVAHTSYGYENNYVQHLLMTNCSSLAAGLQTYDLYLGVSTTGDSYGCTLAQVRGPGTYTAH